MEEDEILESILKIGAKSTAKKFNLDHEKCLMILKDYLLPDQLLCPCAKQNYTMLCFMCSGSEYEKYL